jgi:hypothetical protein
MADQKHDRTTQDVGNIVALEHVNVKVPDQLLATLFYVVGPGPDARSIPAGRTHQHVDQHRASSSSTCRPGRPRCCAAMSAS